MNKTQEFIYSLCFIFCFFMNSFRVLSEIPLWIKWISVSLFLCILGLWVWDTYFSVYIETIVSLSLWVSLFGSLYSLVKLLTVIPIGMLNDKWRTEDLLAIGKNFWMISWIFYYLAWIYTSWILFFIGTVFSGLAWAIIYPWYWTLYKKWGNKENHWTIFGLYYQSINFAYCAWALICAFAILYFDLPNIFLWMVFFIFLSFIWDKRIWYLSLKLSPIKVRKEFFSLKKFKLLPLIFKSLLSLKPWKEIVHVLKSYEWSMYSALWAQSLISLMEFVWFLFVPIIAEQHKLSLSQIAIITAVMWTSCFANVIAWKLWDKYNKKLLIGIFLLVWWVLYIVLWNCYSFWWILWSTFWVFLVIAFLFPLVSALISDGIKLDEEGTIAWVKEFIGTAWEIIWALWFWIAITLFGIEITFELFGYILIMLAAYIICKKCFEIFRK